MLCQEVKEGDGCLFALEQRSGTKSAVAVVRQGGVTERECLLLAGNFGLRTRRRNFERNSGGEENWRMEPLYSACEENRDTIITTKNY